jgi:hypothetical protein
MGAGVPPTPPGPPPKKKSALPWILGIVGVAVIVAVVLILVFVVFKGDSGAGATDAEKVVQNFFSSLENQDASLLVSTMEPAYVEELKDILGADYISLLDDYFFMYFPDDLKIEIKKMESEVEGDRADVRIVEGTITYSDEYGDEVVADAADMDMESFVLVKVDGKWYLSEETLIEMGFDFSGFRDIEDMGMEDIEDLSDEDLGMDIELPIDSEDEALFVIFEDPDIWEWYLDTEGALYDISDENTSYVVYLYEITDDGEEIPYGYFGVDKESGEIFEVVE